MHFIENDRLRIGVSDHGAELCSIYDKENQREILWQADPAYWKRHAPVLFPNVGRYYKGECRIGIQHYRAGQHGFARDMDFSCIADEASHTSGETPRATGETPRATGEASRIAHRLCSTPETKEQYPFDFELEITHTLVQNEVRVSWRVKNTGRDTMYFTIGGHPAFRVPVLPDTVQQEYFLSFGKPDDLHYYLLDPAYGTADTRTIHTLPLENSRFRLTPDLFDHDALIFDGGQISRAGICMPDGSPYVEVLCEGFPNFGIWSVPGAPFVCLEPWMGRTDDCGFDGELSEKPNINAVRPGSTFEKAYAIRIGA